MMVESHKGYLPIEAFVKDGDTTTSMRVSPTNSPGRAWPADESIDIRGSEFTTPITELNILQPRRL